MQAVYDPNKKLVELACAVCKAPVCSIYVSKETKPEEYPEVICKRRNNSCKKKFKEEIVKIEDETIPIPQRIKKNIKVKGKKGITTNAEVSGLNGLEGVKENEQII